AFTVGGGFLNNPGRYLVLLPPVQGQSATTSPNYFTQNQGDQFHAWDYTAGFDWMPDQFVTFRAEFNHREADQNYFAGPGGITSGSGRNTD
ncbi:outer membrane beta-barrel protein, partial [Vibrio parahaemolyticus]